LKICPLDIHMHVTMLDYTFTSSKKGTYEASHHNTISTHHKYFLLIAQF